jgi:hypothetical protein
MRMAKGEREDAVRLRAIPTLMRHAQIWQEDALKRCSS